MSRLGKLGMAAGIAISLFLTFTATATWILALRAKISPLGKFFFTGVYLCSLWFLVAAWGWVLRSMLRGYSWRILLGPPPLDPSARAARKWSWHVVCSWLLLVGCLAAVTLTEFVFPPPR